MINWVELSQEVELSRGSSCLVGRVVSWVELSRGSTQGRVVRVELLHGSRLLNPNSMMYMYVHREVGYRLRALHGHRPRSPAITITCVYTQIQNLKKM